jgi:hypothetical protein
MIISEHDPEIPYEVAILGPLAVRDFLNGYWAVAFTDMMRAMENDK